MGTRSSVLLRALLGVTVIMVQTILKLAFLATTAIAAPAADAEADPFYGYAIAHPAPIVHALPICKVVPKTKVIGKSCHVEPDCTTKSVVVGKALKGHEDPVCTEARFPLLPDTTPLARERLMLKLSPSSASATPLPSPQLTLSRPSPVFLELPSLRT